MGNGQLGKNEDLNIEHPTSNIEHRREEKGYQPSAISFQPEMEG